MVIKVLPRFMTFPEKAASNLKHTWAVQQVCKKLELNRRFMILINITVLETYL